LKKIGLPPYMTQTDMVTKKGDQIFDHPFF
jgi:hypothetical protein